MSLAQITNVLWLVDYFSVNTRFFDYSNRNISPFHSNLSPSFQKHTPLLTMLHSSSGHCRHIVSLILGSKSNLMRSTMADINQSFTVQPCILHNVLMCSYRRASIVNKYLLLLLFFICNHPFLTMTAHYITSRLRCSTDCHYEMVCQQS